MDILNRVKRTVAQALAALPLTALVNTAFNGLSPAYIAAIMVAATSAISALQNMLEAKAGVEVPGLKR